MRAPEFQAVLQAAIELVFLGQLQPAARLLLDLKLSLESKAHWQQIDGLLQQYPAAETDQGWAALLKARTLRCLGRPQELVDWAASKDLSAAVWLECAASLNALGDFQKAHAVLEKIIPQLSGEELGIAWARHGFACFNLKNPWEESYQKALPLLSGQERGRALLNYGYCLSVERRLEEANQAWLAALTHFKRNPYFTVWIRSNLATNALNNGDPGGEYHLLMALREAHRPAAQALVSAVWNNLGDHRRLYGELNRAEYAYLRGVETATTAFDRHKSIRDLANTQALLGRLAEALETLETALQEPAVPKLWLWEVRAKILLKKGQPAQAKAALEKSQQHQENWRWRLVKAELARLEGRLEEAVRLLEGLPLDNLGLRSEAGEFPLLFQVLQAAGKTIPQPLPKVDSNTIDVQANGVLQVRVNGRPVDLPPVGRVGELLVFLLERGGQASLETIAEALYPSFTEAKKRRQAIWKLVDKLRETLGWQDSVLALRGAYQLDPKATWHYDIAQARQQQRFVGEFLAGVYSDWALEVGRELQDLGHSSRLDLN